MRLCQSTVEQGATLSEQAVDIHVVEGLDFVARWYYSPLDTDMMIWFDSHGIVTRFQLNSGGQIVDWNCLEGLQTGLIVELETLTTEALSVDAAETIQFDAEVSEAAVHRAKEIVQSSTCTSPQVRSLLLGKLSDSRRTTGQRISTSRARFWKRFKSWTIGA